MKLNYAGTRDLLSRLAVGFEQTASGAVQARAAELLANKVRRVASAILWRHVESGLAAGLTRVDAKPASVIVHGMPPSNGKQWTDRSYVGLQPWWPLSRRRLPISLMRAAALIAARELVLALGASAPPEATALVLEADAPRAPRPRRRRSSGN